LVVNTWHLLRVALLQGRLGLLRLSLSWPKEFRDLSDAPLTGGFLFKLYHLEVGRPRFLVGITFEGAHRPIIHEQSESDTGLQVWMATVHTSDLKAATIRETRRTRVDSKLGPKARAGPFSPNTCRTDLRPKQLEFGEIAFKQPPKNDRLERIDSGIHYAFSKGPLLGVGDRAIRL
jgi:hypothetical protein